jgi:hypothetical protein
MPNLIYVAPILVFFLLAAPGVRLLLLASKTRQAPEFWCGLYFVGASIGISLRVLGSSLQWTDPALAGRLNSIGHIALASGTIAMAIFTQRVFHPKSTGVKLFAGLTIATIVVTTCHTIFGGYVAIENSYSIVAANAARVVPTAWAFFESIRYWRAMERRTALGLSDPVVTNRFLLWSLWTGGVSFLPLIALSARVVALALVGDELVDASLADAFQSKVLWFIRIAFLMIVPVSVTALSLSFFPPKVYLDRIRSRANADPISAPA